MAFGIKIEHKTYINGEALSNYSDDDLLALIARAEKTLEELSALKAQPKIVAARKEALQLGIQEITNILDAKQ